MKCCNCGHMAGHRIHEFENKILDSQSLAMIFKQQRVTAKANRRKAPGMQTLEQFGHQEVSLQTLLTEWDNNNPDCSKIDTRSRSSGTTLAT